MIHSRLLLKEEISSNNDEDVQDPISILLSVFEDQINF